MEVPLLGFPDWVIKLAFVKVNHLHQFIRKFKSDVVTHFPQGPKVRSETKQLGKAEHRRGKERDKGMFSWDPLAEKESRSARTPVPFRVWQGDNTCVRLADFLNQCIN